MGQENNPISQCTCAPAPAIEPLTDSYRYRVAELRPCCKHVDVMRVNVLHDCDMHHKHVEEMTSYKNPCTRTHMHMCMCIARPLLHIACYN